MTSRTTKRFRMALATLPVSEQQQARKAYQLFSQDPRHPSMRFKRIHGTEPIYSARINIDYRAVGVLKQNAIIWFWIGSHADYEKLLSQL